MSTNSIRDSLSARPTYTRQASDNSQIELMRQQSRPTLTLSRSNSNVLPTDVFEPEPSPGDNPMRPTVRERLTERLRLPTAPLPQPVRSAALQVVDMVASHWRDFTVAGLLTALVSWAIWATVKITKVDNMPFCVFDDSQEP